MIVFDCPSVFDMAHVGRQIGIVSFIYVFIVFYDSDMKCTGTTSTNWSDWYKLLINL